jgi:radical SAM superfamily enzyme YgiQ (UPF0313 family)
MKFLSPDQNIKCLLLYPEFSSFSFWNTREISRFTGAKATAAPLSLMTVAAIMPQWWEFKLLDLNAYAFDEAMWEWCDIVVMSGMLPQQKGMLDYIDKAREEGKYIVVGGPDPSSQPDVYAKANAVVTGEGEITLPIWLDSWRNGIMDGVFGSDEKPDLTQSPCPRYDLINMDDYYQVGVQYARGCPFNCEFCDIIELFGRKPRSKTPEQFLRELDCIYNLGHRGYVEIVDDNFIGNKRLVKRELLPALIAWNKARGFPFFFGTEASMNMADDDVLMQLMQEANFRFVFLGIETPDPETLLLTQKSQNTMKPVTQRVHKILSYGIIVTAGFIVGFDGEKPGNDRVMIDCIEDSAICMAMVGLLVALPNTQLSRRLQKEGRLLNFNGELVAEGESVFAAHVDKSKVEVVDQTIAGLNFIPTRDRAEILREYKNIVATIYSPKAYMDRVLRMVSQMPYQKPKLPHWKLIRKSLRGAYHVFTRMMAHSQLRWLFLRNVFLCLRLGSHRFELAMTLMAVFLHFDKQSKYLLTRLSHNDIQKRLNPEESSRRLEVGSVKSATSGL